PGLATPKSSQAPKGRNSLEHCVEASERGALERSAGFQSAKPKRRPVAALHNALALAMRDLGNALSLKGAGAHVPAPATPNLEALT
ncbi:MAG: hypothetical protein RMK20_10190, partial [Verrucomicrobiales bacterium]|nr:hypothetical protein [Verrucomicrobiales bacterium]